MLFGVPALWNAKPIPLGSAKNKKEKPKNLAIFTAAVINYRLKSKQLYILQGLPQVGPVLAKRLIQHFKSVSNVMNATVGDLAQVGGIGKISGEKIRRALDTEVL